MGNYCVEVGYAGGASVTSDTVMLAYWWKPSITSEPQDLTTAVGGAVTFSVSFTGVGSESSITNVQWFKNGSAITPGGRFTAYPFDPMPGERFSGASLKISGIQPGDVGSYRATGSNPLGSVQSRSAILTIAALPTITTQPQSQIVHSGDSASFSVAASSSYPLSYQWLFNGTAISGAIGSIYTMPSAQATNAGDYSVRVSHSYGGVASSIATLTVLSPPVIIAQPQNQSVFQGDTATFSVTAAGTSPLSYKWMKDVQTKGGNASSLVLNNVTADMAGNYLVEISNAYGSITSNPALLQVKTGFAIADLHYGYSRPYLLDFGFTLRDFTEDDQGHSVAVSPSELQITCKENGVAIPLSETAFIVEKGYRKQFKAYVVLDYTRSMTSLANGDADQNGISDAVHNMEAAANHFLQQLPADAQVGLYEFHSDIDDPLRIKRFTSDKPQLQIAISNIWSSVGLPMSSAASRCWDAVWAAVNEFGSVNSDENRYVIFISDGYDTSSSYATLPEVVAAAQAKNVRIYCVAYGQVIETNNLKQITSQTGGRYFHAPTPADLDNQFDLLATDLEGQYLLRWATLKRTGTPFVPSFEITVGGRTASFNTSAASPASSLLPAFTPNAFGTNREVLFGSMRLIADADDDPDSLILRTTYAPRNIRKIRIHYHANYPCQPCIVSTNIGEILYNWTMEQTNDGAGGKWLELSSPNPSSNTNDVPYGAMGNLVRFDFGLLPSAQQSFSLLQVDNTIYTNISGPPNFRIDEVANFISTNLSTPQGTPIPWLHANGFTGDMTAAEMSDPDKDGVPTWQEYVAGTNPRDASSKLTVRAVTAPKAGQPFQITISTVAGKTYRMETATSLGSWSTLQDGIVGTGSPVTATDNRNLSGVKAVFYRVSVY